MRPAFTSTKPAVAFAFLLLVLLLAPVLAGKKILSPREQSYATQSWGSGPYPWIQNQLFEDPSDIDVLVIGSSHVLHCLDAKLLQAKLSEQLGRPATVRVVGWGGAGYDALYFITKDLLEHRRAHTLVFYDEYSSAGLRNNRISVWFRWADNAGELAGLPLAEQAHFYFGALVGLPRNLLARVRPNLPADLHAPNFWEQHYGSVNLEDNLGSTTSKLGFTYVDADPSLPFESVTPPTASTAADAFIYSAATATNFNFGNQPLPAWQIHFARKFADLATAHDCQLIMLHIPTLAEIRSPKIEERTFWPELMNADVALIGIPPAKMFAGISEADARKYFFNPFHLNANGQAYFTSLILPDLLQLYAHPTHH